MNNFKKALVNFLGSLGYLSCLLQWLWVVILYSDILKSVALSFKPNNVNPVAQSPVMGTAVPSLPMMVLGLAVVVLMIIITVYVIIKMPVDIAKNSKKVVKEVAERAAPFVLKAQHKKITEKNRIKLTPKLIIIVKLMLIIIPVAAAFASFVLIRPIFAAPITIFVNLFLAGISLLFFGLQYLIAKIFALSIKDIR